MLYKYEFVKNHSLGLLNKHLNFFFRKIRNIPKNSAFVIDRYFHSSLIDDLNNSPVLKKKIEAFFDSYKILDQDKKDAFYQLVLKCQSVEAFFEDIKYDCQEINNTAIKALIGNDSLYELTKYLFSTTLKAKRWGIEDHYIQIYDKMPAHKACPFCGVGEMHKTFREDYDHLCPKKHYPLLAINLKNLAPMCGPCNTKFKGEVDVFYDNKVRRQFAYPYSTQLTINIDYSGSIIPETDINNSVGFWKINFLPVAQVSTTWFEVFQIEKRYRDDYLVPKFESWVNDFIDDLVSYGININNSDDLKRELKSTADRIGQKKFIHSNIIKAPLFDYLASCENDIFYNSVMKMYVQKTNKNVA
ncbi:hypothetical protein [Pedobacter agri]|uniref:hypothetical protein n=1 Tax=Pedobacter agri TaxID=454586 RepID=UPI00292E56A1|nr:hypothetical protein [Pedobacter agri]